MTSTPGRLARRLGLFDAVVIGLASMVGAGVFAVFAPAAQAAGAWLPAGLALALGVAACNATSTAQLAATYPTSGGTYVYGREQLGPWWGFAAGWCFVIGKTASCAAMATTFAAYTVPGPWQRPVAALAVLALTAVSWRGITRTAGLARVIVAVVLVALAVAVLGALLGGARPPAGAAAAVGARAARGAPGRRPDLLRLRRVRTRRHPRRGGPRAGAHHPARHRHRARCSSPSSTPSSRSRCWTCSARPAWPPRRHRSPRPSRPARGPGRCRSCGSAPRRRASAPCWPCSPGSPAPPWPWRARATCPAPLAAVHPRFHVPAPRGGRGRGVRGRRRAPGGPARAHRLQLHRRAALLRRRQPRRAHAGPRRSGATPGRCRCSASWAAWCWSSRCPRRPCSPAWACSPRGCWAARSCAPAGARRLRSAHDLSRPRPRAPGQAWPGPPPAGGAPVRRRAGRQRGTAAPERGARRHRVASSASTWPAGWPSWGCSSPTSAPTAPGRPPTRSGSCWPTAGRRRCSPCSPGSPWP